jgi:hypothetical protein
MGIWNMNANRMEINAAIRTLPIDRPIPNGLDVNDYLELMWESPIPYPASKRLKKYTLNKHPKIRHLSYGRMAIIA